MSSGGPEPLPGKSREQQLDESSPACSDASGEATITRNAKMKQTIEQIGRVQEGLLHLYEEVGTSNPDLFRVLAEGPLDMLGDLQRDLEHQLGTGWSSRR